VPSDRAVTLKIERLRPLSFSEFVNRLIKPELKTQLFVEMSAEQCERLVRRTVSKLSPQDLRLLLIDDNVQEQMFAELLMESRCRALIDRLLSLLPEREQRVMRSRTPFADLQKILTLEEIANREEITRERVRQIEQRCLARMRVEIRPQAVRDLLDLP